jgi:amidase
MIDRRSLLRNGTLAGAAAALASRSGSAQPTAAAPPSTSVPAFELDELTVVDLQKRMTSGADSAKTLCEKYIARIEALDKSGPGLRAVLEINPDALAIAERMDAERKAGKVRGPLHGIPVLIKDNIGTADRMQTTAGSLALVGAIPANDAHIARRLRDAGAVILGKTNLSEWANFRSTHSQSGWSARGGQCRNPYALDRDPSGSSSGSGSAAAANLCALTVGTETDGSIVSPSNNCALVGFKPTVGLVSRTGIIPISHTQDTAGPMTRTVADAAALLTVLCGYDPADAATRDLSGKAPIDYTRFLDPKGLKGARIGVPRKKLYGQSPAADRVAESALDAMRREGAIIVDPADIATLGDTDDSEFEVLLYEFKADLNAYLAGLGGRTPYKTLKDLIAFNEKNREKEMPYFGQEVFEKAEAKGPLTDQAYIDALAKDVRATRAEGIDKTMDEHKLDCLVAPTSAPASLIDLVNGSYGSGGSSSFPAIAGYPDVTIPAGWSFGLPVGLSFFGRAGSEATLFRIVYAFEQATKVRKAPRFLPTVDLTA